jgi:hypothetical protein
LKYHKYNVRTPGVANELENRDAAARREHAMHLAARGGGALHVSDAKSDGDGVHGAVGERNARRVAAHEADTVRKPSLLDFFLPDAQHRVREVDADNARARLRMDRTDGQVRGSRAQVQHALATRQ